MLLFPYGGCGDPRGRENALPHADALRQPSGQLDLDERWCRCARRRAGDRDWLRRPRRHSFGTLVNTRSYDQLRVSSFETIGELAVAVAEDLAVVLRQAMAEQGEASAIFATGNSQLAFFRRCIPGMILPGTEYRSSIMNSNLRDFSRSTIGRQRRVPMSMR